METPAPAAKPTKTARKARARTSERRATLNTPSARRSTAADAAVARRAARGLVTSAASALGSGLFAPAAISTNLVSELNNIDFKKMIGGPLQAAVDAQVASSLATVNFINAVGFTDPANGPRELVMVDFSHTRNEGTLDANGQPVIKAITLKVPLLAMLPIPSLRIEHVIIDFNVKLNSVETSTVSTSLGVDASVSGGWGPVNFKVSASFQRKATTGVEVKKEYALNVNVKAVQDEIPGGLEKILNMLAA